MPPAPSNDLIQIDSNNKTIIVLTNNEPKPQPEQQQQQQPQDSQQLNSSDFVNFQFGEF